MLKPENIAIIGGGAIGTAFSKELIIKYPDSKINIFSRKPVNSSIDSISHNLIDYNDISSIHSAAELASSGRSLDLFLVATGIWERLDWNSWVRVIRRPPSLGYPECISQRRAEQPPLK